MFGLDMKRTLGFAALGLALVLGGCVASTDANGDDDAIDSAESPLLDRPSTPVPPASLTSDGTDGDNAGGDQGAQPKLPPASVEPPPEPWTGDSNGHTIKK